jgi:enamine deaminase RidA (YjgF/YER057c/UK114 family)
MAQMKFVMAQMKLVMAPMKLVMAPMKLVMAQMKFVMAQMRKQDDAVEKGRGRYPLSSMRTQILICSATAALTLATTPAFGQEAPPSGPPTAVRFYGNPSSPISGGVAIPANAAFVWTSGTVPPVVDQQAKPDSPARFGDTKTQAVGVLQAIEKQLAQQGLTMKDVVYLRAYLVADPNKGGKIDTDGWNEGYKQFFGTTTNPTKPARSTVGVAALVNPAWLVEIEAFAVYQGK